MLIPIALMYARHTVRPSNAQKKGSEQDFADWFDSMLSRDPYGKGWHFVMDRLNTHMSEAAVRGRRERRKNARK